MSHRKKNKRNRGRDKAGIRETVTLPADKTEGSEEHQKATSENGKCYRVKTSDIMGRYLEAARDIPAGALLMSVEPLVVGPIINSPEVCLGCYTATNQQSSKQRCGTCSWPLCSQKCKGVGKPYGHTKSECDFLKTAKYIPSESILNVIVPLRCLLLKTDDPKKWDTVMSMESHDDIRRKIPLIWETNQKLVVDRIIKEWGKTDFLDEEIHRVCGVLEVNAFEVSLGEKGIRGLYEEAFLFSHDCIPNTRHSNDARFRFEVRTTIPVRQGETLKISYAYALQGTMRRQEHLKKAKFFQCRCDRCTDPAELGTNMSTLICPKCSESTLLSTDPLDISADWRCSNNRCADFSISGGKLKKWMDELYEEAESINGGDIEGYERFLSEKKRSLDSGHYLMMGVKYSLSQLYGKTEDFLIHELPPNLLHRKIALCEEVLTVADKITPGLSLLRGTTMYELQAPLMILATRDLDNSNITKQQFRLRLKRIKSLLTASFDCLKFEPSDCNEGAISHAAKEALDSLKDWERVLGKF